MSAEKKAATVNATINSALWGFINKASDKEFVSSGLEAGGKHTANLTINGTVDGEVVNLNLSGDLLKGFDSTRASSSTPAAAKLLALVLSKLNTATRSKILSEIPETFAANGNELPEVDKGIVEATENMLSRLRSKVQTNVKGSVTCQYRIA